MLHEPSRREQQVVDRLRTAAIHFTDAQVERAWANLDQDATWKAMRELLARQRPDGGWPDLDSMESSVHTTGQSLYALQIAGLPAFDAAYRRAIQFLLKTPTGGWLLVHEDTRPGCSSLTLMPGSRTASISGFQPPRQVGNVCLGAGAPDADGDAIGRALASATQETANVQRERKRLLRGLDQAN
ncbi:MAG TPA: hypothetical protein VMH81_17660 [Bryobacteraceae bacterium]|nr:hypothetical protein [Bryobacteraceae bacterium]